MRRSADFLLSEVAGTSVIVPTGAAAGRFSGMVTVNGTGAYLWELLEKEQSLEALTEALVAEYEVDRELARRDAEAFVKKLIPVGAILEN